MKSLYYQFVNFIQEMDGIWFGTIWLLTLALTLVLIMKFYKAHNGTQKSFEKISLLILAIILFSVLIYLTYLRK